MNHVIIACAVITLASAAVIPDESQAQILNYQNTNDGAGNYEFSYETSNGITRQETGRLVNAGTEEEHIVVEGSYSYTDVDGLPIFIKYTADENGYKISPPISPISAPLPGSVVASLLGK